MPAPIARNESLLSPTVTDVRIGMAASADVTTSYWVEMAPASVCDSFFSAADPQEPTVQDPADRFWG
jgi:hypothetical protein